MAIPDELLKLMQGPTSTAGYRQAAAFNEQEYKRRHGTFDEQIEIAEQESDIIDPLEMAREDAADYAAEFSKYMDQVASRRGGSVNASGANSPRLPDRPSAPGPLNYAPTDPAGQGQPQAPAAFPAAPATVSQSPQTIAPSDFAAPDLSLPSETIGQIPISNAFSTEAAAQVNPLLAPQSLVPQGPRTQGGTPLGEFLSGGLQLDPQGRMIDPSVDRSFFEQQSAARETRAGEQFGQARGPDSRDRDLRGTMSRANAVKLTGGDRAAADALLKRQELGLGEFKPETLSPADQLARDKFEAEQESKGKPKPMSHSDALALRKYEDTLAKEAAGIPLSPSDQLAREKWEAEKAKVPEKSATERNIERLMQANPDLSYSDAVNIEQNVVTKTVNPLTGATETTNIASGQSTPVTSTAPLPSASLDLDPVAQEDSLFQRGQKFTGAIEAGKRGAQRVAGQLGLDVASDESQQTKKELDAFQGSLVRAFQEGDRFSTGQDKVLREELDATLGAMKDPETFKNNAIALDKVMRQRHADLIENWQDTTMDSDFRADSRAKARVLETAIRDLGVTQDPEGGQPEAAPMPEGINKAVTQDIWDAMTPEEQAVFK